MAKGTKDSSGKGRSAGKGRTPPFGHSPVRTHQNVYKLAGLFAFKERGFASQKGKMGNERIEIGWVPEKGMMMFDGILEEFSRNVYRISPGIMIQFCNKAYYWKNRLQPIILS